MRISLKREPTAGRSPDPALYKHSCKSLSSPLAAAGPVHDACTSSQGACDPQHIHTLIGKFQVSSDFGYQGPLASAPFTSQSCPFSSSFKIENFWWLTALPILGF